MEEMAYRENRNVVHKIPIAARVQEPDHPRDVRRHHLPHRGSGSQRSLRRQGSGPGTIAPGDAGRRQRDLRRGGGAGRRGADEPPKVLKALQAKAAGSEPRFGPTSVPDYPVARGDSGRSPTLARAATVRRSTRPSINSRRMSRLTDAAAAMLQTCRRSPISLPRRIDEALRRMKADARAGLGAFVAGGTDLYPNMKRRQQTPHVIVDVARSPGAGAAGVAARSGRLVDRRRCDAHAADPSTRWFERQWPVLAKAAGVDFHSHSPKHGNRRRQPAARHPLQLLQPDLRVAEGDRLLHEEGRGDLLGGAVEPALLGGAVATWRRSWWRSARSTCWYGPGGERVVPAGRFYHNDGINYLTKQPDEILTAVRLPAPDGWDAVYHKLRRRGSFDFPVLGVATWVKWVGGRGTRDDPAG